MNPLSHHRYTIIDEADELLQSDWESDFNRIMSGGGKHIHPLSTPHAHQARRQRGRGSPLHDVLGHFQQGVPPARAQVPVRRPRPRPHWTSRQYARQRRPESTLPFPLPIKNSLTHPRSYSSRTTSRSRLSTTCSCLCRLRAHLSSSTPKSRLIWSTTTSTTWVSPAPPSTQTAPSASARTPCTSPAHTSHIHTPTNTHTAVPSAPLSAPSSSQPASPPAASTSRT